MSPWGKLIGGTVGMLAGGPLGAVLGVVFGHSVDSSLSALLAGADRARAEAQFFESVFQLSGVVAKSDGRVSETEVAAMERVMERLQLSPDVRRRAIRRFNEGKEAGFAAGAAIARLREATARVSELRRLALEILAETAFADGRLKPGPRAVLQRVAAGLGVGEAELAAVLARHGGLEERPEPYTVLEISEKASNAEVKRAYRRLMARHHPDKLVSKGVPKEMLELAAQRTREIREAYDQLRRERGF